jgi:hypothetical protein
MAITITTPADTHVPLDVAHTSDHNTIVDALTTLGSSAANTAGDTFTGDVVMSGGIVDLVGAAAPSAPAAVHGKLFSNSASGRLGEVVKSTDVGYFATAAAADTSVNTAALATPAALTKSWTIPANDANAGTLYRLTFYANGTMASTAAVTMLFQAFTDGVNAVAGGGTGTISASEFAAAAALSIRGYVELIVVSTGAGGTCFVTQQVAVSVRGTDLTGTAANNSITVHNANTTGTATKALDTTASHTVDMRLTWGSVTNTPTASGFYSTFERVGP